MGYRLIPHRNKKRSLKSGWFSGLNGQERKPREFQSRLTFTAMLFWQQLIP